MELHTFETDSLQTLLKDYQTMRSETAAPLQSLSGRVGQGTFRKALLDIDTHLDSILYG